MNFPMDPKRKLYLFFHAGLISQKLYEELVSLLSAKKDFDVRLRVVERNFTQTSYRFEGESFEDKNSLTIDLSIQQICWFTNAIVIDLLGGRRIKIDFVNDQCRVSCGNYLGRMIPVS